MDRTLDRVIVIYPISTAGFANDDNRTVFKNAYTDVQTEVISVITHGEIFHADEVLAIAILQVVQRCTKMAVVRVARSNINEFPESSGFTYKDLQRIVTGHIPYVYPSYIIDCGGLYNNNWAFDHHQDKTLEAASSLVARKFFNDEFMTYHAEFFKRISDIDCDWSKLDMPEKPTEFSKLIRLMNAGGDDGFMKAVHTSVVILKGMINEFIQYKITKDNYYDMIKAGNVRYNDEVIGTFRWQKYAVLEGVKAIITKYKNVEGQYVVLSRDTKEFIIPEESNHLFRHNSGFMATFSNMEDAMNAVNGGNI